MEVVRAAALTGYFEVAETLRLNVRPLLREVGLTQAMLRNPEQPIPARAAFLLAERSAHMSGCLSFGLRMVERRRPGDIGMLSILIAHQPSLRAALEVVHEYRRRLNPILEYETWDEGDTTNIGARFLLNPPAPCRQATEIAVGVLFQALERIFPESWRPVRACFTAPGPSLIDLPAYERLFRCPLAFGAPFDGFAVLSSDLDRPNPRSDPQMALHVRKLIETLTDADERSFAGEVKSIISTLLPDRRVSITAVADGLGLQVRTLQRRLGDEKTQFGELVEEVRSNVARRLLTETRMSMTEIARQVGFSAETSFSRWHRARFGESPSATRNSIRSNAGV